MINRSRLFSTKRSLSFLDCQVKMVRRPRDELNYLSMYLTEYVKSRSFNLSGKERTTSCSSWYFNLVFVPSLAHQEWKCLLRPVSEWNVTRSRNPLTDCLRDFQVVLTATPHICNHYTPHIRNGSKIRADLLHHIYGYIFFLSFLLVFVTP